MTAFTIAEELETVRLEQSGRAMKIVLNRPQTLNAWIPQLGLDLQAALKRCAADDVGAVVISGEGRGFSSGADLGSERAGTSSEVLEGYYHDVILGIRELPKPVIAAVHGAAAGVGCSLALACDLVLMGENAFLLLAFVNIGLVPDGGASLFVPARAGAQRAFEMALLGERIRAPQALEWGLASKVVPDADVAAEAEALVTRLAAGPTQAYGLIKQELNAAIYPTLREQLALEARLQDVAEAGPDHAEGVAAFLEKRAPRFGRTPAA
jgi:2-(1,2-epoxy-1,2-dihydrophenyl)acetyl-CoA isomerase